MTGGLIGGEGFAVDASIVKADASRLRSLPGAESINLWGNPATSTRAVREYRKRPQNTVLSRTRRWANLVEADAKRYPPK